MIDFTNHKTLAFIPVRAGSMSIKMKNIKLFCGKPLIYWVLNALSRVDEFEIRIVVATDSDEIEEVINNLNFENIEVYRRTKENAQDNSTTESVMLEYLLRGDQSINLDDYFMLVQATSPFTRSLDFGVAMNKLKSGQYDSLLSCTRIKRFFWTEDGTPINYSYLKRPLRQDFDGILLENGAFYINKVNNILKYRNRLSGKIGIHEMPEYTSVELDNPDDWVWAEWLMYKYVIRENRSIPTDFR